MTDNSRFIMALLIQFSKSDSVLLSRHLMLDLALLVKKKVKASTVEDRRFAIAVSSGNLVCILVTVLLLCRSPRPRQLSKAFDLRLMVPEGEFTTIMVGAWQSGGARTVVESLQRCHR